MPGKFCFSFQPPGVSFATTGGLWACGSFPIMPAPLSSWWVSTVTTHIATALVSGSLWSFGGGFFVPHVPTCVRLLFLWCLVWHYASCLCRPVVQCLRSDSVLACWMMGLLPSLSSWLFFGCNLHLADVLVPWGLLTGIPYVSRRFCLPD